MPLRNPFRKAPTGLGTTDASSAVDGGWTPRAGTDGDSEPSGRSSSSLSVASSRTEPDEYKMSVVDDCGVYLPPSPPAEKTSFWGRSNSSSAASNHRTILGENGQFSISRESFESYRRSFDISARSPVIRSVTPPRRSEEVRSRRMPAINPPPLFKQESTPEETPFEDVGLHDDVKPKRRGLFSRLADSSDPTSSSAAASPSHHHHYAFPFTGRRRGQSGQGAELGNIPRPATSSGPSEVPVGTA